MIGDRLIYGLAQLSGRERLLVAVLAGVVVPLGVLFAVVQPLMQQRDAARSHAFEARAMLEWVSQQVEALPPDALTSTRDPGAVSQPIGISGIEQSLMREDLRDQVTQLSDRSGGGGVELEFDAVPFDRLTGWLQRTVPDWGYRIAEFRIEKDDDPGLVSAYFALGAAP
jgi:type II secretory pathway component PulM